MTDDPTADVPTVAASYYPEWFERIRERIYKGIEWLVRFSELVLLAAVFQYAADKTHNPELGLLAWLLGFAAIFYVAEYLIYVTRVWFNPGPRKWWRWGITIAALALVGLGIVRSSENMQDAIKALETTQR